MEKKIEKRVAKEVYDLLNGASLGKMTGTEKLALVKTVRVLKPAAAGLEDAQKDAAERLKPEGYDERLRGAIAYEQKQEGALEEGEYRKFLKELTEYNRLVGEAVKEAGAEAVTLEVEPLGEEALGHLLDGNDWTVEQVMRVADFAA